MEHSGIPVRFILWLGNPVFIARKHRHLEDPKGNRVELP
jgi:hypothetical protein